LGDYSAKPRIATDTAIQEANKKSRRQAQRLLAAAKNGDAEAQYKLGVANAWGLGVDVNDAEARKWLRLAAQQGHFDARYLLAVMDSVRSFDAEPPFAPK